MTAFLQGIGQVVAGGYASARLSLTVPSSLDTVGSTLVWELLDQQGRVWNRGSPTELSIAASQTAPGQSVLSAECEVAVPGQIPVNDQGTLYQLRWTLSLRSGQPLFSFENFTVLPSQQQFEGAQDAIELVGDVAGVYMQLPRPYTYVEYEAFRGNAKLFGARSASAPETTTFGPRYKGTVDPSEYTYPSLDPISVIWSYWNGTELKNRETTQLFVVTPVILDAVQEMQAWLNRAYTDSGMQPGTTFTPMDYVKYLRTGRDAFNAAVKPTNFTMTAADGPIRWFWIGMSCVAAARAQYLAEGMKAFNYSGQAVQLDVDRTPFWDQTAQALESQLMEQLKPFKDNLAKRGNIDGDGSNSLALRRGAVGAIGITIHGASPIRGQAGLISPMNPVVRF